MRRPAGTSVIWFLVGIVVGAAGATLVLGAVYYLSFMGPVATSEPGASAVHLSISNETTISVVLAVNGTVIETVRPGGYEDPITAVLPPLPWSVETRTTAGRVLSRLTVREGDVVYTTPDANGSSSARGDGARVDLSCGRLDVWAGPPMLGPIPGPGLPGDCDA